MIMSRNLATMFMYHHHEHIDPVVNAVTFSYFAELADYSLGSAGNKDR
jgi:hypothetical protein